MVKVQGGFCTGDMNCIRDTTTRNESFWFKLSCFGERN